MPKDAQDRGLGLDPAQFPGLQPQDNFPKRITINGVVYPCSIWQAQEAGQELEFRWTRGLRDGMNAFLPQTVDGGFTDQGFYQAQGLDVTQAPWLLLRPAYTATVTITALDPEFPVYTFIATGGGTQWLYVLNKSSVYKIRLSDNTLQNTVGFAGAIMGRPILHDGFWYLACGPTAGAQFARKLTTITGDATNDTYTTLALYASHFQEAAPVDGTARVARTDGNNLYFQVDPSTTSSAFEIGDTSLNITDILFWQKREHLLVKPDGVYRLDPNSNVALVEAFIGKSLDLNAYSGSNSFAHGPYAYWVSKSGLKRILEDRTTDVGPDADPRRVDITLDGYKTLTTDERWLSFTAWGPYCYATYGHQVFNGKIQADGKITWYGVLFNLGSNCRVSITDGPILWVFDETLAYRVDLADDGSTKTGTAAVRGGASETAQLWMSSLHMGEMTGRDLSDKRKQARRMWMRFESAFNASANCTMHFRVHRDSRPTSELVGSTFVPTTTSLGLVELHEEVWTAGTNDLFYTLIPQFRIVTAAGYTTGQGINIRDFGIQAVTPNVYRCRVPLIPACLTAVNATHSIRQLRENLLQIRNAQAVTLREPHSPGEESPTFNGYVHVSEQMVNLGTGVGWMMELTVERYDFGGAA